VFGIVLAIKYTALSLGAVGSFFANLLDNNLRVAVGVLTTFVWITSLFAIPACLALLRWWRSNRPSDAFVAMAAIFLHAVMLMIWKGQDFANHYLLQALIGVIGMLAAARQRAGESAERAWAPMAWLGLAVWGLAGVKKIISGSYLNGEFLSSRSVSPKHNLFAFVSDTIVGHGGGQHPVPVACCVVGRIDVGRLSGYALVAISVGMALAEISPVFVARLGPRKVVGWLMLGLATVATSIANEMDFGLVLIALAALWGEGRAFRRLCVLTALAMAGSLMWPAIRLWTRFR